MLVTLLLSPALAQDVDQNTYTAGVRAGLEVPVGGVGLGVPLSLEAGVQFPSEVALGARLTVLPNPPRVGGVTPPPLELGPAVDIRLFFPVNPNLDFYASGAVGFLFGVDEDAEQNTVSPRVAGAVGARLGGGAAPFYLAPEVGIANLNTPTMGLAVGYLRRPAPRAAP